jgi:hypothetical protein
MRQYGSPLVSYSQSRTLPPYSLLTKDREQQRQSKNQADRVKHLVCWRLLFRTALVGWKEHLFRGQFRIGLTPLLRALFKEIEPHPIECRLLDDPRTETAQK